MQTPLIVQASESSRLTYSQVESDETLLEIWLRKDKSPLTQKHYQKSFQRFQYWLQANNIGAINQVTALDLLAYADSLPEQWSDNYRNQQLAAIKSLFSFAANDVGYLALNPGVILTLGKPEPVLPERILQRSEVEMALEACSNPEAALLVRFLFSTGLRAKEALSLTMNDLGEMGGQPRITVRRGKGNKTRVVNCFHSGWAELKVAISSRAVSRPVFDVPYICAYRWVRDAFAAVGKKGVSPHWLRHAFVIEARVAGGMDWPEIANQLGQHVPAVTLKVYAHLTDIDHKAFQEL